MSIVIEVAGKKIIVEGEDQFGIFSQAAKICLIQAALLEKEGKHGKDNHKEDYILHRLWRVRC